MGDDEIQLNVAVLLLDASNADGPVYLPEHHTFLFTANNFSAGDVVPTSTHANREFGGRVKSLDVDNPLMHREVRSYISNRNDSNYDVHFEYTVLIS